MKLPSVGDPGGDAEGSLLREDVLEVLFQNGVAVIPQEDGSALVENGEVSEVQYLPEIVRGKMVGYLARKFDIAVTEFYVTRKSKIR